MATEASSDSRCGIGSRLRAARERSGLSILQAAEKLHADPRVLEALEAEKFDDLGAAVFVRGHIRRYAELVREQPQELQDMYAHSSHAVARPDLTRIPTTGSSRAQDPGKLLVPGLMFVIAVGLIGLVWWVLTSLRTTTPPAVANRVEGESVILEPPVEAPQATHSPAVTNPPRANTARRPSEPAPVPAPAPGRSSDAPTPPQASEASESPPPEDETSPIAVPSSGADAILPGASASADSQPPAPAVPGGNQTLVTLRFSGDSWAEVYDARGNKLFYDIGSADSVKTLSGAPPLRVILGNPAGVAVEVNGKTAPLPQVAGAEKGIQFSVNRSGRISRARAAPSGP